MTYRKLQLSEWHQLTPEFEHRSVPLPDPRLANIYGAFDDEGNLSAWLVYQLKLHSEPLVSLNPMALLGLIAFAEKDLIGIGLQGVECFIGVSDDRVQRLVTHLGFRPGDKYTLVKRIGEGRKDVN